MAAQLLTDFLLGQRPFPRATNAQGIHQREDPIEFRVPARGPGHAGV